MSTLNITRLPHSITTKIKHFKAVFSKHIAAAVLGNLSGSLGVFAPSSARREVGFKVYPPGRTSLA
jgi:hypothetical protein